jgi:TonB family protein
MRLISIVGCVVLAPLLLAASEPKQLQPSSPWVLDYDDDSCRLIRNFGEGSSLTRLVFESIAPGEMSMLVVGKPLRSLFPVKQTKARFVPVQDKAFTGVSSTTEKGESAGLWANVPLAKVGDLDDAPPEIKTLIAQGKAGVRPPPIDLAKRDIARAARLKFAADTTALEIDNGGGPILLETGSMAEPIRMFDQCDRDMLSYWGVDPKIEDQITRPVWAGDARTWFSSNDYPASMARKGTESAVNVRLLVNAAGQVTKCTSLSHYDSPEFNQAVCGVFTKRARFQPAELADGTRVPSYYTQHIVFKLAS